MKAMIRVKCPGLRSIQKEGEFEIKGPCDTGSVVTFIADIAGRIIAKLSNSYIEIEVSASDYTKCKDEHDFKPIF